MTLYRDIIISHYKHPLNRGKLDEYTHKGFKTNPTCGDEIEMRLLIEDELVKDVKFEGKGCAISLAACSLLTDYIKGEPLKDVNKLKYEDIVEMLGGGPISPGRIKCAKLGLDVLKKATQNE